MKICTKCNVEKLESEFYFDKRKNNEKRISRCKVCYALACKVRAKKKYEPSLIGKRHCGVCRTDKDFTEFTINRSSKNGRGYKCKKCVKLFIKSGRRKARKIYSNGKNFIESDKELFHIGACEVCNKEFPKMRPKQTRCTECSKLVRNIHSHLSSSRGSKISRAVLRVTVKIAVEVARLYCRANNCCYCDRKFTKTNKKSLDHVIPICLGGINETENISISCIECNRAKAWLGKQDWINLCRLVCKKAGIKI